MFKQINDLILKPLSTRLGTMVTGGLIGLGANAQHADWVGTGIAGGLLIGADLLAAWLRKRSIERKAVAKAVAS
ncbi:MAG TPA: hypothetical protein VIL88_12095 [Devosia sp.]|uniref:hypothetical protein n=1 Tax=Devosia sp. TaxID=1871048 RepID=UPI002F9231F4